MSIMSIEIRLESSLSPKGDFKEFLHRHRRIDSFQEVGKCFKVRFVPKNDQEYRAFTQEIKEVFQADTVKETHLCQATCRDNTNCFNRAKYGDFCSKHKIFEKKWR